MIGILMTKKLSCFDSIASYNLKAKFTHENRTHITLIGKINYRSQEINYRSQVLNIGADNSCIL